MHNSQETSAIELLDAIDLYHRLHNYEKLRDHYVNHGKTFEESDLIITALKKHHRNRIHHRGVILVCAGSFLLVLGFVLSVILFHAGMSIDLILFGPTCIGAVLLIWGMNDIFG